MSTPIGPGHEEGGVVKLTAFTDERGAGLVEVLVSVGIIAIILTIFLSALSTGGFATRVVWERVTAENLARAQLECIKDHPYIIGAIPISYTTTCTVTAPSASYDIGVDISYWYSLTNEFTSVSGNDSDMQWITVTVFYDGKSTFTIEEYKVRRE